jgi:hypothetical protein
MLRLVGFNKPKSIDWRIHMSNEKLDKTKASGEQAESKAGELKDADLESVAGGIVVISSRRAPVPTDGRGITGVPIPDDGRGIVSEPIPDDGKPSR